MPAATPKSENPLPAPPQLQCSSPTIAGSTTPKELNVVAVMRKKTTLIAAKRDPGAHDHGVCSQARLMSDGKIAQRLAHRGSRALDISAGDGVGRGAVLRKARAGFRPATARAWR